MNAKIIAVMGAAMMLVSCSETSRERQLEAQMQQIKLDAAKDQKKLHIDNFKLPQRVTFPPNSQGTASAVTHISNSADPLLNYPIRDLRFTGTIMQGNQINAYILAPDNMVYPVKVGDPIGNEGGKVISINMSTINISVQVAVPGEPPSNQIVSLQIKE